jgi:1,4-dihydroxy-2-naphthoyl-CoA hydrolase
MNVTKLDLAEQMNRDGGGFCRVLGIRFVHATAEEVLAELDVSEVHHQVHGIVHGGVYAGLIETVCSVGATAAILDRGQAAVGLENHTSFLRAVRGGRLSARARPLNVGKTTQVWEASVTDDQERLLATGRVRLYCLPLEAALASGPGGSRA